MRYRFADFELDTSSGRLLGADGEVPLRPQALALLRTLIERAPALVTQDQILDAVWGELVVSPNSVPQAIRELRKALGDSAQSPRYIETRHRLGYRLLPSVQALPDATTAAPTSTAEKSIADAATHSARRHPRGPLLATAIALLAVIALILLWPASGPTIDAEFRPWAVGEPRDSEALAAYRAGVRSHREGDLADAEAHLHAALRIESNALATFVGLAQVLADAGDWKRALDWLEEAEAEAVRPGLPRTLHLRLAALRADLEGDTVRSRELVQTLFDLEPGDTENGLRLVERQRALGEWSAAERTMRRLAELPVPMQSAQRLALAKARLQVDRGDAQAARATLAAVAQHSGDENSAAAHLLLAQAALVEGGLALARDHAESALAEAHRAKRPALALEAGLVRANMQREAGEFEQAEEAYQRLHSEAVALGHHALGDRVTRDLALLERVQDRSDAALERIDAALHAAEQRGDLRSRLAALRTRGLLRQQLGQLDEARADLDSALTLARSLELAPEQAALFHNIGLVLAVAARDEEAAASYEQALALFETLGDRRGEALALSNLAALAQRRGHGERAHELNQRALGLFRQLGMRMHLARVQFNLGLAARERGALPEAAERIEEAMLEFADGGAEAFRRQAVATLVELELMRGEIRRARTLLDAEPEHTSGDPLRRAALLTARARMHVLYGEFEHAEALFRQAHDMRRDAGYEAWRLVSELDLAELAMYQGHLALAERLAGKAAEDLAASGHTRGKARALLLQAEARWREGRSAAPLALLDRVDTLLRQTPDSALSWRYELLSALVPEASQERLDLLSERARAQGFELIALEAEMAGASGLLRQGMREALAARGLLDWAEVWLTWTPWRSEEA